MFHSANYLYSYFEVSKPFKSFFSMIFTPQVKQNQYPCLMPLPVFTPRLSLVHFTVTFYSLYILLIHLLLSQSIPIPFKICLSLVQFTWQNAFCQSLKHAHNSSSMSKVFSDIILSIPNTSLVPTLF